MFRRGESKEDCVGDENERKVASRAPGSGSWVAPWTLLVFGPQLLGRAKGKAKVLCLQ